jgi:NTE family protein
VHIKEGAGARVELLDGMALCMSGGGYRAMVFQVGALWRLNELGLLRHMKRISSVSGGSITAGVLAMNWNKLEWDEDNRATNFQEFFVQPIRRIAGMDIDSRVSTTQGLFTAVAGKKGAAEEFAEKLEKFFRGATLASLPDPKMNAPEFYINATNLQTGNLFIFTRDYVGDSELGKLRGAKVPLSKAVAASAAFPPIMSPLKLNLEELGGTWEYASNEDYTTHYPYVIDEGSGLRELRNIDEKSWESMVSDLRREVVLADGGIYDNLALDTAWKKYKTVFVSDGGGRIAPDLDPKGDWLMHGKRVAEVIDYQVRSLRKRQVLASYQLKDPKLARKGAFWSIRGHLGGSVPTLVSDPQPLLDEFPFEYTRELAAEPTRLTSMSDDKINRLINWGYAKSDFSVRGLYFMMLSHSELCAVQPSCSHPPILPYSQSQHSTVSQKNVSGKEKEKEKGKGKGKGKDKIKEKGKRIHVGNA